MNTNPDLPQSDVKGVSFDQALGRWKASTAATGHLGFYIHMDRAEKAMKLKRRTRYATKRNKATRVVKMDADYSEDKQNLLNRKWG